MSIETVIVPFPDANANPKDKKDPKYGLAYSDAMIAGWRNGRNMWSYDQIQPNGFFDQMKQYLESRQDTAPYQRRYYGTDKNGAVRKGYNNISFEIHPEAKKHRSTIHKLVLDHDVQTRITSNTKNARSAKKKMKAMLWHDSQANELRKLAGVEQKSFDWIPETKQENEHYEKLGGFRLPLEYAMTEAAKDVFSISNWEYNGPRAVDDLISTSHTVFHLIDNNDGSVGFEYIPIREYDSSYVDDEDIDPPYAGHYKFMRIEELVPKLKKAYPGITDDQIKEIAKSGLGLVQNRGYNLNNYVNRDPVTQRWTYYDMMVRVYCFYFKSIDTDYYVKDGMKFYQTEWGKEINKGEKKTEVYSNYEIYCGIRIVSQPYVVDYGCMANKVFNAKGEPILPYAHVWTGEQSIVQGWKPWLDEIQMVTLKQRAIMQGLKGDKTVYDLGILANMDFGAGVLKATEVVRYAEETNRLFVQTKGDAIGRVDTSKAIYNLPGANKDALLMTEAAQKVCSLQIMSIAGITPAMSASTEQPDLVGLMQNEINQTSNAMFILIKTFARLRKKLTQMSVSKIIRNCEYVERSRNYYSGVIDEFAVNELRKAQDQSTNQIGIQFITKPDEKMKMSLEMAALESLKAGKNGYAGISTSDYYAVIDQIHNGSLEMATFILATAEERAKRYMAQERSAATQETGKVQMQSAQVAEEEKRKSEQFFAQIQQALKKAEIFDQLAADTQENNQLFQQKMKEIVLEKSLDTANKQTS
jgi:hypothetical protein